MKTRILMYTLGTGYAFATRPRYNAVSYYENAFDCVTTGSYGIRINFNVIQMPVSSRYTCLRGRLPLNYNRNACKLIIFKPGICHAFSFFISLSRPTIAF